MDRPQHDYGHVLSIDAESIGQPGQRTFRLLLRSSRASASIWLEKEQLDSLGQALVQMNEQLERERPSGDPDVEAVPIEPPFDLDFRAGRLSLGYVEGRDLFVVHAFDLTSESDTPRFRCFFSRGQSRVLARQIERAIEGGRPICPLCESPMDASGHVCPRSNGHQTAGVEL